MTTKTIDFVAKRKQLDLEMMKNRDRWPQWPILPIKRRGANGMEVAILFASEPFTMFNGPCMFLPHNEWPVSIEVTPEQLIEDGWEVD